MSQAIESGWLNTLLPAANLMLDLLQEDPFSQRLAPVPDLAAAQDHAGTAAHKISTANTGTDSDVQAQGLHDILRSCVLYHGQVTPPKGQPAEAVDSQQAEAVDSQQQQHADNQQLEKVDNQEIETVDSPQVEAVHSQVVAAAEASQATMDPVNAAGHGLRMEPWKTPSPATWKHISDIAVKVLHTLQFIFNTHAAATQTPGRASYFTDVKYALVQLLHGLLVGHFKDNKLNFDEIMQAGVVPLVREWGLVGASCAVMNTLVIQLLGRWVHDERYYFDVWDGPDWFKGAELRQAQVHSLWQLLSEFIIACSSLCLPACLKLCLSVCLPALSSVCLPACLPALSSVCLPACLQ